MTVLPTTILVTGGAGFIGSWSCELLIEKGYKVIVYDDLSSGKLENLSHVIDKVVFVKGDICSFKDVYRVMREYRVDAVLHLAAIVSVVEVNENPFRGLYVNFYGTLNILEAMRRLDVDKIVYASSAAVYGDPVDLPIKETHPLKPKSLYGVSKLSSELLLNSYREVYGLKPVILRYFNVYGPRMKPGAYASVIYKFIESIISNKPLTIYGDGLQTRDFVYVEDVARANIAAIEKNVEGVYNIGSGVATNIRELASLILRLTHREDLGIVYREPRPGDIRDSYACIEKAVNELSWKPRVELVTGLKKTIDYFLSKELVDRE